MKLRWMVLAGIGLATIFFLVGCASADKEARLSQQTLENLSTVMHGEAFAYAKYLLFAENARESGNSELAKPFEETAKRELFEHFAEDNLRNAIRGETYEVETMYKGFAEQAAAAGDKAAVECFDEVRK